MGRTEPSWPSQKLAAGRYFGLDSVQTLHGLSPTRAEPGKARAEPKSRPVRPASTGRVQLKLSREKLGPSQKKSARTSSLTYSHGSEEGGVLSGICSWVVGARELAPSQARRTRSRDRPRLAGSAEQMAGLVKNLERKRRRRGGRRWPSPRRTSRGMILDRRGSFRVAAGITCCTRHASGYDQAADHANPGAHRHAHTTVVAALVAATIRGHPVAINGAQGPIELLYAPWPRR
jgi:hypothetical protein